MKKKTTALLTAYVLAICFVLTPFTGVFASNGDHITVSPAAPATCSLETGECYILDLVSVFNEPNAHSLTYTVSGYNLGPHTYIAFLNGNPSLVCTFANAGIYYAAVRATCSAGDYAEFTIVFTVTLASDGTSAQYSYDETDQNSVRVYVTVSHDGMPIQGYDGTVIANLPVDVPYFDLEDYGLEDYYRYGTIGYGEYTGTSVIERPTALHLYLYLLENYFMSAPGDVMDYTSYDTVYYMDGTQAYTCSAQHKAFEIYGSPASVYIGSFWGHSDNLMYFRNHVYPLMSPGWGATCDYMLLSDGDVIELAMLSDIGGFGDGAFLSFDGYDRLAFCSIGRGQTLTVYTQQFETYPGWLGSIEDTEDELVVSIYDSSGTFYGDFTYVNNNGNTYTYTLPMNMPVGLYYVVAMDPDAETSYACMAPAVMTLDVY